MEIRCEKCDEFTRHDAIDSLLEQRAKLNTDLAAANARADRAEAEALDLEKAFLMMAAGRHEDQPTTFRRLFARSFIRRWEMPEPTIPYVADWTSESEMYISEEPTLQLKAIFTYGRRGDGFPILGKMNPMRQREVVLRWLCQVCAQPLGQLGLMVDDGNLEMIEASGTYRGILEPAACFKCFCYAALHCPGLNRNQFNVLAVKGWRYLLPAITNPHGNLENDPAAQGAVGYIKVVPVITWGKSWPVFLREVKSASA